jgi:hypothetical protein
LLIVTNNDDSFGCWYLHAEMELVDDDFKLVNEAPSKKCEVWLVHFDHVKGYVLCSRVGCIPEGYRQRDFSQGVHSPSSEAIEWDVAKKKVTINVYAVEGAGKK